MRFVKISACADHEKVIKQDRRNEQDESYEI